MSAVSEKKICLGFDLDGLEQIDSKYQQAEHKIEFFEKLLRLLEKNDELPGACKIQSSFVEALGEKSFLYLKQLVDLSHAFKIPVIWDAKRGDIGNSNKGYVTAAYSFLNADAITINPYMGTAADFFVPGKTTYVLAKTSNPEAQAIQCLKLADGSLLYQKIIHQTFADLHHKEKSAGLPDHTLSLGFVMGATHPTELENLLQAHGQEKFKLLIPGIGAQGGDLKQVVSIIKKNDYVWQNTLINVSRGIIFAYKKFQSSPDNCFEASLREMAALNFEIRNSV